MAQTTNSPLPIWLKHFDTLESTNNYAMQAVDDGLAQNGWVIWADKQLKGKGQRGNTWKDSPENLKFSLIIMPGNLQGSPILLNMLIAATIAHYIESELEGNCKVSVKWPNDIYINDKKACGLLIENRFKGNTCLCSVIGIGLNVNQVVFPEELKRATSMRSASNGNRIFDFKEIITALREAILKRIKIFNESASTQFLSDYNQRLFKKNTLCRFRNIGNNEVFKAEVVGVNEAGMLILKQEQNESFFQFGTLEWLFE